MVGRAVLGQDRAAARAAARDERAPGIDLPRDAGVLRIRIHPFKNFAVAFSGSQLLFQCGEVEAEEILDVLVEWRVVSEFAVTAGDGGAAFIQQPRQNHVAAETAVRAARRTLGEIGRGDVRCVGHNHSIIGRAGVRSKILLLFESAFSIGWLG